jgi:hypothetical protein
MGSGHAGWGVQIIDHFPDASQIHAAFFRIVETAVSDARRERSFGLAAEPVTLVSSLWSDAMRGYLPYTNGASNLRQIS